MPFVQATRRTTSGAAVVAIEASLVKLYPAHSGLEAIAATLSGSAL
jgi:hypothetical protein